LNEIHDDLSADELKPGFIFGGERVPLVNPRRGIFKPQRMSISSREGMATWRIPKEGSERTFLRIALGKKLTGLTDRQRSEVLEIFRSIR
jgi:hypothetical protein